MSSEKSVIRLNLGSHPPQFLDETNQRVTLRIDPGETVVCRNLWYKGKMRVNLMSYRQQGNAEPLWVMTNLPTEVGGQIYFARIKIEDSFRDLKNLLRLEKVMIKQQAKMEQVVAWVLFAFTLGFLVGEELRDVLYGPAPDATPTPQRGATTKAVPRKPGKKWKSYSGLFILLKRKMARSVAESQRLVRTMLDRFRALVQHPARTCVQSSSHPIDNLHFALIMANVNVHVNVHKFSYSFLSPFHYSKGS